MFNRALIILTVICSLYTTSAQATENIRAIGSSTVYPFISLLANKFDREMDSGHTMVESIGTGGGFKLFCAGDGEKFHDIVNASRPITKKELELCAKNGVNDIEEIKIGLDGIIIANHFDAPRYNFSQQDIFLAISKEVPKDGKLVSNYYKKWNEINPELPDTAIKIYGPPISSGTRDTFVGELMEKGCKKSPEFKEKYKDNFQWKEACHQIRTDGAFVDSGENDKIIVEQLMADKDAFGIFGFNFLYNNPSSIHGNMIDGVDPDFKTIKKGNYPLSRPLYVYVKESHYAIKPHLKSFIKELVSDKNIGENGYLVSKGLVPLDEKEIKNIQSKFE